MMHRRLCSSRVAVMYARSIGSVRGDCVPNLFEGRQPEPNRPILPGRIDAIHAEPQGRAVATLREFDGLARDSFGLAFQEGFGRHRDAMASAFWFSGIAALKRLSSRIARVFTMVRVHVLFLYA